MNQWDYLGLEYKPREYLSEENEHDGLCGPCPQREKQDDAGRCCMYFKMGEVELRNEGNFPGHTWLYFPGEPKGYGFYPKGPLHGQDDSTLGFEDMGRREAEGGGYTSPENTDTSDGHVMNDTGRGRTYRTYKLCPETLKLLKESIEAHESDDWGLNNVGARNCAGWALERLDDAGLPTPAVPDAAQVQPNALTFDPRAKSEYDWEGKAND